MAYDGCLIGPLTWEALVKPYVQAGESRECMWYSAEGNPTESDATDAYINAKVPAYGIKDGLKADNMYSNITLAHMLTQVDGFRKSPVSDLLD
ncbi:hypothetical protein KIW84_062576 [Lathyrus oleraceus]|uniref:Uncharacterized protein n=1 Tax=Pisum sativum TaxID=3888 RepID=A0A9D5A3Q9_PEA|nr:hypothetical protein KIW84_062576 [Pisum sativum]